VRFEGPLNPFDGLNANKYQFVNNNTILPPRVTKSRAKPHKESNPALPYDLWEDLA
jgi:hypothetical protein